MYVIESFTQENNEKMKKRIRCRQARETNKNGTICLYSVFLVCFWFGFNTGSCENLKILIRGGPRSVMATTPDSHAGGPRFKSRCRPTKKFGAQTPPYPASRSQRYAKGPSPPERGHVGW